MVAAGNSLATVKEVLGHSSLSTVLRYTHPTANGKMEARKSSERLTNETNTNNIRTELNSASGSKVVS